MKSDYCLYVEKASHNKLLLINLKFYAHNILLSVILLHIQLVNLGLNQYKYIMQIQINTDRNIEGHERLEAHYTSEIEKAFHRFDERITRVEVHFSDENSAKTGVGEKKCLIEARVGGLNPFVVSNFADTTEKAFNGAVDKIKKVMTTSFEKLSNH